MPLVLRCRMVIQLPEGRDIWISIRHRNLHILCSQALKSRKGVRHWDGGVRGGARRGGDFFCWRYSESTLICEASYYDFPR